MAIYTPGKGRRKGVKKFKVSDGLWMLGVIVLFMVIILFLMTHGYITVDFD